MPTLKSVTEWLEKEQLMDAYKEFAAKVIGRRAVNLDVVFQWAKQGIVDDSGNVSEPPACPERYDEKFGRRMTRDELRNLCGNDVNARKQLRKLVIEKWETEEAKAAAAVGFQKTFDNFD